MRLAKQFVRVTSLISLLLVLLFNVVVVKASNLPAVESLNGSSVMGSPSTADNLATIERENSGSGAETSPYFVSRKLESLQQEVQELRGRVEEQQHELQELSKNQREFPSEPNKEKLVTQTKKLDVPVTRSSLDLGTYTLGGDETSAPAPASGTSNPEGEASKYQSAHEFMQNKSDDQAENAFLETISEHSIRD
ncbi:MAG TPA: YbgF trimerization domain-containing protein [Gammaproteobacteria bacterium]|nr:YbgF trimerization domain-containing protein [Gammaproteobacteria bacterium]